MSNTRNDWNFYQSKLDQKEKNYNKFVMIIQNNGIDSSKVDKLLKNLRDQIDKCQSDIDKYSKNTIKI